MAEEKAGVGEQETPKRELYPPIEPFNHGWLEVSELHEVYYEQCGNVEGTPVIYLSAPLFEVTYNIIYSFYT